MKTKVIGRKCENRVKHCNSKAYADVLERVCSPVVPQSFLLFLGPAEQTMCGIETHTTFTSAKLFMRIQLKIAS